MELPCPCGHPAFRPIASGISQRNLPDYAYQLHRCAGCGLVRTLPVPSAATYRHGDAATLARIENEDAYRDFARSILQDVERRQPAGRLLDVGCNIGLLVEEAQSAGYEAWGIDLDPGAIAYGCARGRRLLCGELSSAAVPEDGFDAIVANHVLEHVEDVAAFLRQLRARLRPGGYMFINVPNWAGLVPQIMNANWGALWPHQHVWQFTPASLRTLVEREAGLRCLAMDTRHNLEPPSTRDLKGTVKLGVIALSLALRRGDELRAVFQR